MPLFLCYSHHWTLQRKLRDGEEREHKSEREEEGEEADGIEDEFGVSFATVALVNDWIQTVLMSGGQRWRRLKFRRTPLKRCLPSLFSTRMGSSLTWRPRSIKIETRELDLLKLCLHFAGMLHWVQQTKSGFLNFWSETWGQCTNRYCGFSSWITCYGCYVIFLDFQSNWGWNSTNKRTEVEETAAW